MKKLLSILVAMLVVQSFLHQKTFAQTYRTDGGVIVIEDSLLLSSKKQVVFVVTKNILQTARVEFKTMTSDGLVNEFTPLNFPQGLVKGQIIPIWNSEPNSFNSTPWLYLSLTIFTASEAYYQGTMTPVNYREQYKEPMITSISESGGFGTPYTIIARGIFDTTIPSLVLINHNVIVSSKSITQIAPGIIQFTMLSNSSAEFPPGKYLLTICQAAHCDTLQGRHR